MGDKADGAWTYLDLETARCHHLYGLGGWASLLAIGVVGSLLLNFLALIFFYQELEDHISLIIGVILSVNLCLLGWQLIIAYQFFAKKRGFRLNFIIFGAVNIMLLLAFSCVEGEINARATISIIVTATWTLYVFASRRINVTFLHRIKQANDSASIFHRLRQ